MTTLRMTALPKPTGEAVLQSNPVGHWRHATTCRKGTDCDRINTDNKSPSREPAHGLHCFGHRIICVQRNSASLRPLASSVTTASQTCVVRPRCCAVATQAMLPSLTVPR